MGILKFDSFLSEGKKPTVTELIKMFTNVNKDAEKSGESVVDLSDTEYYAQQIQNI